MGKIVVGVDGSECGRRALEWAIAEAELRDTEVIAVHAWQTPVVVPAPGGFAYTIPDIDFDAEAHRLLDTAIKEATGGTEDVKVERRVVQRPATEALVRAADGADMLVIGSRGLGGFSGLLLGSVGQQCAHHARCPVVIIPHEDR